MKQILIILFIFISFNFSSYAQNNLKVSKDEARKWREDLQSFALEMPKKHPNLYHTLKKEDFLREVKKLDDNIPNLSRHEIIVELTGIVASVGDGHSSLPLANTFHGKKTAVGFRQFPMDLYIFKEGLFVKAASSKYKEIVGGKIIKIGKTNVDEALKIVSRIVSHDNEMSVKERLPGFMIMPEVLHALRITDNLEQTPFVFEINGEQKTVILKPSDDDDKTPWIEARANNKVPLWLKKPWDSYWFEYLPESKTVYFQYNAVVNKNKGEKLKEFFKRLFDFVKSNKVERLIIDLRLNTGGNGVYNWDLIYEVIRSEKINAKGKLFAIIGRKTFSAGTHAAILLDSHTKTIFVGEPTGGNVNSYGDHLSIKLPNSGIEILVSQYFYQNTYPWDKRIWIEPEIKFENSFEDFRKNRDVALDLIFNYQFPK